MTTQKSTTNTGQLFSSAPTPPSSKDVIEERTHQLDACLNWLTCSLGSFDELNDRYRFGIMSAISDLASDLDWHIQNKDKHLTAHQSTERPAPTPQAPTSKARLDLAYTDAYECVKEVCKQIEELKALFEAIQKSSDEQVQGLASIGSYYANDMANFLDAETEAFRNIVKGAQA